jgi:hypothetical protein
LLLDAAMMMNEGCCECASDCAVISFLSRVIRVVELVIQRDKTVTRQPNNGIPMLPIDNNLSLVVKTYPYHLIRRDYELHVPVETFATVAQWQSSMKLIT